MDVNVQGPKRQLSKLYQLQFCCKKPETSPLTSLMLLPQTRILRSLRYRALDSLRGIAALGVVFYHCYMTLAPQAQHQFATLASGTPLVILLSGRPFVILFFVLSGFALASSQLSGTDFSISGYLVKRIFRVYVPYVFSLALSILIFFLVKPQIIYALSGWFNVTWSAGVTTKIVLGHLLLTGVPRASTLNNVNWSLVYEMRISLVFPLIVLSMLRIGAVATSVLAIVISGTADVILKLSGFSLLPYYSTTPFLAIVTTAHFLVLFSLGAVFAGELRRHRETLRPGWPVRYGLLLLGFYLLVHRGQTFDTLSTQAVVCAFLVFAATWYGSLMRLLEDRLPNVLSRFAGRPPLNIVWWAVQIALLILGYRLWVQGGAMTSDALSGIGAAVLIFVATSSPWIAKVLEHRLPLFLGRISYSLYLVHLPILIGFTHLLFGRMNQLTIEVLVLATVIPVATIANRFVEEPAQRFGRNLARRRGLQFWHTGQNPAVTLPTACDAPGDLMAPSALGPPPSGTTDHFRSK